MINITSVVIIHLIPMVVLGVIMVAAMPETFIKPVQAAYTGLLMLLK